MTTPHSIPPKGEPSRFALWLIFALGNAFIVCTLFVCYFTARGMGLHPARIFAQTGQLVVAHVFGGRIVNAGVGVQMNLPDWFVVYQCWVYDFILMCFGYLLFALGFHRFANWPIIGPHLDSIHEAALAHSDTVRPYGLMGVMIFVIVPTGGFGPMVGAILGYILGLGAGPIFVAIGVADLVWTILFVYLYAKLAEYSPPLAMASLLLCIGIIVGGVVLRVWRGLRRTVPAVEP